MPEVIRLEAPIAPVAVHPFDQSMLITAAAIRRDTSRSVENGMIPVYMSTARQDRHGSTIRSDAWTKRMGTFRLNPVMQWSHIPWIPTVGNALDLQDDGVGWVANLKFATNAWSRFGGANLALLLEDLMTDDMLRAVSPGFIPHDFIDRKAVDMPQWLGPENVEYTDVELMEISPCNVPSNREALQKALQRGKVTDNGLTELIQMGVLPSVFNDAPIVLMSRFGAAAGTPTTKPEERMPVPKVDKPATESRAVAVTECPCCANDSTPCGCASQDATDNGSCSCHSDCAGCVAAGCDGLAAAVSASAKDAPKQMERVIVLPPLSAEVLRKRAKGEALTTTEQASVDTFEKALVDLGITKAKVTPVAEFRAVLKSSITALRCGDYYDDYYDASNYCPVCYARLGTCNDAEDVSPEDATAEQATITAMIGANMQKLSAALAGWNTAEHDALRAFCSEAVYNAMYGIERLWRFAEFWYDDLIPAAEMPADMPGIMRAFTEAIMKDPVALKRAGAVLSATSKKTLQKAIDLHTEMGGHLTTLMDSANKSDNADVATTKQVGDSQVFRIAGLPDLDRDEDTDHYRLSVADESGTGTESRSNNEAPSKLYDARTLPVKAKR